MTNRCNGPARHEMIEVVNGLKMCECKTYGFLQHLKGAVDEARRLIAAEGGYDAVRARLKREADAKRKARAKDKAEKAEMYLSYGRDKNAPPVRANGKVLA